MFEKEAEEYKDNTRIKDKNTYVSFPDERISELQDYEGNYIDISERIIKAFKDGAEFGYNEVKDKIEALEERCEIANDEIIRLQKANEWHYVKDGDLPKGLPKPVLITFHNKFSDKIVIDIARYSLELNKWWFIHDLQDLEEDVIAWKEIVLPELPKESE